MIEENTQKDWRKPTGYCFFCDDYYINLGVVNEKFKNVRKTHSLQFTAGICKLFGGYK